MAGVLSGLDATKPPALAASPALVPVRDTEDDKPRDFGDPLATRKLIYANVLNETRKLQPVANKVHTLELVDADYEDPDDFPIKAQKKAILEGGTLSRRLRGTWRLRENATGNVIDERKVTIATVPHMTNRGTFILNGTEYTLANQMRLRPGVFTRVRDNGEIESHINVLPGKGPSSRVSLDPATSIFRLNIGQGKLPLLPILKALGKTDSDLRKAWGNELYYDNAKYDDAKVVDKLYEKLRIKDEPGAEPGARVQALRAAFERMELDPEVTRRTLGGDFKNVGADTLLATTQRLVAVNKGEADPDDRDHLAYQNMLGPEDLFAERVRAASRVLRPLLWRVTMKKNLTALKPEFLSRQVQAAITGSGLGQCFDADTKVLTRRGFVTWPNIVATDEFACRVDDRLVYRPAIRLFRFDHSGSMIGCRTRRFSYLVTPSHRVWTKPKPRATYRFERADEAFGRQRWFETSLGFDRDETIADFDLPGYGPVAGDTWAEFLGWYIAEGWVSVESGRSRVCLSQCRTTNPSKWADLKRVLDSTPWRWLYNESNKTFFTTDGPLAQELLGYGHGSDYKRLPRYVFTWSRVRINLLVEAYIAGDGNCYNGYEKAETTSSGLADDLVEAFGLLGFTGRISRRKMSDKNAAWSDSYVVSLGTSTEGFVISSADAARTGKPDPHSLVEYTGPVYCAEVPGGLLYVMRDGKPHWSGNSLEEINPADVYDQLTRVSRLGEGGIPSIDSVPDEARSVQPSHFGFIDPLRTPESFRVGVDTRLSYMARKGRDGRIYTPFLNVRTGKTELRAPQDLADAVIAFPGELDAVEDTVRTLRGNERHLPAGAAASDPRYAKALAAGRANLGGKKKTVAALVKGKIRYVPRDQVDYALPEMEHGFSPLANMIPLKSTIKGQRVAMGSRMLTQALPPTRGEAPLVQSGIPGETDRSYEEHYGRHMGALHSDQDGEVLSVSDDEIKVRNADGTVQTHEVYNNFPLNRKSVTGDTRVWTRTPGGRIWEGPIRDFFWEPGSEVLSIDPVTKASTWRRITGFVRHSNDKKLVRVKTVSGRYVDVTVDHSLVTIGSDGNLVPVYPLDCVVGSTRLPVALLPHYELDGWEKEQARQRGRFAGLYLAEGHLPKQGGLVSIAVQDAKRADEVLGLLRSLGLSAYRNGGNVCFTNHEVRDWLEKFCGRTSGKKFISPSLLTMSKDFLLGLVEGYFGGDGCLWEDGNGAIQVAAVSTSERLRDGIAAVLSALGVFVTFFPAPRKHLNDQWADGFGLRVISRHLHKLPRWFFYGDRETKLRALLKTKYRSSTFEAIPVPREARRLVYDGLLQVPHYVYKSACGGYIAKERLVTATGIFGAWARSDVMWDVVESIGPIPHQDEVFDFCVEDSEVFAVNGGLVVHNTYIHSTPVVQPGQRIKAGDILARSNYTDDRGTTALGLNMRTAYIPWQGLNFEDATVISRSAAKRLTSEHMYQHDTEWDDRVLRGKNAYVSLFANRFDRKTLESVDDDGVIKPGSVVESGQPLVLMARERERAHNQVSRGKDSSYSDATLTWDHHAPGIVTDVAKTKKGVVVAVKSVNEMQVGDKLSGRYGDKGVISAIVEDEDMPRGPDGRPYEVLVNPLGVITRTNPGQMIEAALGKIAEKTGKPYKVQDFKDLGDMVEYAQRELAKHNLSDVEDVVDPSNGRKIPGIFTGNRFFMKLHHTSECFDDRTEALTSRGWIPWPEVQNDDELATLENGRLIFERPLELVRQPYDGELCCFEGRYVDYAVTPNHRFYVRGPRATDGFRFDTAVRLHGRRFVVPQFGMPHNVDFRCDTEPGTVLSVVPGVPMTAGDYAELVGWWATEGYARVTPRRACVVLYQSRSANPDKLARIEALATRLGLPWSVYRAGGADMGVAISSRPLAEYLKRHGTHSHNKRLPRELLRHHPETLRRAFDAMMAGDGSVQETATGPNARYTTVSKQLADDFQELCIRTGLGGVVRKPKHRAVMKISLPDGRSYTSHCRQVWECGVALSRTVAQVDGDRNSGGFSRRRYRGVVYCANMRTGLLYVRRNGKPMLSGNSKGQGRGTGGYTAEETPAKGGESGSKRVSLMDINAFLSHGATEVGRDAGAIRGQKNQDWWAAYMMGKTPAEPRVPLVYRKFVAQLQGSGINPVRTGGKVQLMALTNKDVAELTGGRTIETSDTVDWKEGLKPIKGGLFDPTLTGGHNGTRWAAIDLPEPMPNPVMEEPIRRILGLTEKKFEEVLGGKMALNGLHGPEALYSTLDRIDIDKEIEKARAEVAGSKKTARDAAIRRLAYLKSAKSMGLHPRDWMLDKVPVLPPAFRPVSLMSGNKRPMVADPNYLYKEVMDAATNLKEMRAMVDDVSDERVALYKAFKGVTGLGDPIQPKNQERKVKGILKYVFGHSPKFGVVQRKLLGSTVDLVGRAVITPNPDLDMDQVGIPETKAWEIYRPFIVRRLVRHGVNPVMAARMAKDQHQLARKALTDEMGERPVIITRAPVLHRYGTMAFFPRLVKGETLQVPPTIVKGFAADFDGDAMNYHVPVSDGAVRDAVEKMLPSKNLFSAATFGVHYLPQNEYVGGLFEATREANDTRPEQVFQTKADAIRAYQQGRIDGRTRVVILRP